jgi:hypothetical protein
MRKATYELQRLDIFKHLNGRLYQVDDITWVGGDSYKITCIDDNDSMVDFRADVHTSFEIVMTYSKAGA